MTRNTMLFTINRKLLTSIIKQMSSININEVLNLRIADFKFGPDFIYTTGDVFWWIQKTLNFALQVHVIRVERLLPISPKFPPEINK